MDKRLNWVRVNMEIFGARFHEASRRDVTQAGDGPFYYRIRLISQIEVYNERGSLHLHRVTHLRRDAFYFALCVPPLHFDCDKLLGKIWRAKFSRGIFRVYERETLKLFIVYSRRAMKVFTRCLL